MNSNKAKSVSVNLADYILEYLYSIAKQEGFIDYSISKSPGASNCGGFTSYIVRVVLEGSKAVNGSLKEDKLYLICKFAPENDKRRQFNNIINQFERESCMYKTVLPALVEFQKEKNISTENGFYDFAKCYLAISDKVNNQYLIVLEDLSYQGYKICDKHLAFDLEHSKLFLAKLAKLHALSFGLRVYKPQVLEEFKVFLNDIYVSHHKENPFMRQYIQLTLQRATDFLDSHDVIAIDKMKDIHSRFYDLLADCVEEGACEPFGVIIHSDCWSNNYMYQYDQENIPKRIQFLDWQLSHYGSPALDISFFMFTSTDAKLRRDHYDELLRFYYTNLETMLANLECDAAKLFTFENLQEQLRKFGIFALILSPIYIQVLTTDPSLIPDMDTLTNLWNPIETENKFEFFDNVQSNAGFKEYTNSVVRDCIRYGYC